MLLGFCVGTFACPSNPNPPPLSPQSFAQARFWKAQAAVQRTGNNELQQAQQKTTKAQGVPGRHQGTRRPTPAKITNPQMNAKGDPAYVVKPAVKNGGEMSIRPKYLKDIERKIRDYEPGVSFRYRSPR